MEIAALNASEKSAVQEHSESLTSPETPAAAFREFASKVIGAQKAEAKSNPEPKETKVVDLYKATPEQREEWNRTGAIPKPEPKKESSEPQHGSETKTGTKEGEINPRAEVEPRIQEIGERAWREKLEGQDFQDFVTHVDKTAQTAVDHISKHANRAQIESGLKEVFGGLPQSQAQAMYHDLTLALSEVRNPGEVLAAIGMDKLTRDAFRLMPSRAHMRSAVHGLAIELLQKAGSAKAAAKAAEPRPRAPKPPSEVGGRGAPPERADIAAARSGNFAQFDQAMRAKYRASR